MATIGDQILSVWEGILTGTPEVIAAAVATWETARQVIRTVASGVAVAATQGTINTVNAQFQEVPLSPAVLADMSVRNINPGFDLATEATLSGINGQRFAGMVLDTGESYGIDEALRLWKRGAVLGSQYGIDEAELDKVIYYSRVRDEFIPDLKLLAYETMSSADAIDALVKGHTTTEQAAIWFQAAGGMPEQFDVLVASSGDSIGVEKAVDLHAHGLITDAQLAAVVAQSRINPEFYDVARLTNSRWLAPYQLEKIVAAGMVDAATATQWLIEDGYQLDQASAFVATGMAGATHSVKAETSGMVIADYEAQIITEAEATTALEALGYTPASIPLILDAAIARRVLTMRNAAITRVRQAYLVFNITESQVQTDLAALGVPTQAIGQFLTAWTIEQQTDVKRLTAAQVGKLATEGVIDGNGAVNRWVQMGYAPSEAELLLYIYQPAAGSSGLGLLTINPGTLPADGQSTANITLQAYNPAGGQATQSVGVVAFKATLGTIGDTLDHKDGTYSATYTAPTTPGTDEITGTVRNFAIGESVQMVLTAVPPAA